MSRSEATSVDAYLSELPPDRATHMRRVVEVIRSNLPPGYAEGVNPGRAAWEVPLAIYPDTYNAQPLLMAALASHKSYMSLYLNTMYAMPELRCDLDESGRKLRMGKSCINFKSADELPLDAVAEIVRRSDLEEYGAAVKAAVRG